METFNWQTMVSLETLAQALKHARPADPHAGMTPVQVLERTGQLGAWAIVCGNIGDQLLAAGLCDKPGRVEFFRACTLFGPRRETAELVANASQPKPASQPAHPVAAAALSDAGV